MGKKSQSPNKNGVLRDRKTIQADLNQAIYDLGKINTNVHLLHKEKGDLLLKIERLYREPTAPEVKAEGNNTAQAETKPPEAISATA